MREMDYREYVVRALLVTELAEVLWKRTLGVAVWA